MQPSYWLFREKAAEAEREIERHQILERERAKTRELRHSLDLETEKRTQVGLICLVLVGRVEYQSSSNFGC